MWRWPLGSWSNWAFMHQLTQLPTGDCPRRGLSLSGVTPWWGWPQRSWQLEGIHWTARGQAPSLPLEQHLHMASFGSHVLHFHKIGKDELVYLRKCSDLPSIKMTQFIAYILHVPVKPVERAKARGDDCRGLQQLSTEMPRCRCKSSRRVEGC